MIPIYQSENIRIWDQFTIENEPVSSVDLMERAATAFTKQLLSSNHFNSAAIFCGPGNNGGDGLVAARLLFEKKIDITVFILNITNQFSDDFKINLKRLQKEIKVITLDEQHHPCDISQDIIIDAIFGSGLNREAEGFVAEVIHCINNSAKKIVSIDIPSGLFCDDNKTNSLKNIICADQTISFQSPKRAFLFSEYHSFTGEITIADIGLSENFHGHNDWYLFTSKDIQLKERSKFSHKGNHGYLQVFAGLENFGGAAVLASKAALRSGCGYVAVATEKKYENLILGSSPELLFQPIDEFDLSPKTSAIAIGPGLGKGEKSLQILKRVLEHTNIPKVLDADALNLIATEKKLLEHLSEDTILTPHLAELERLIGKHQFPEDRIEAQIAFSKKYNVIVLQKGAYSKITFPNGDVIVNSSGNANLATAGSGDVLTGIIGSLLAQNYSPQNAVKYGVFIHGYAGDMYARNKNFRSMIASDIIEELPAVFSKF